MVDNENMCKVITSGYCPYADGVDEDVKSCADCPWYNPEAEQRFFEEVTRMVDRSKVLVGLESCADRTGALCRTCPYDFIHNENCMGDMARDALELLREQPEQKFFVGFDGKITPLPIQKHGYWVPIKSPTGVEYGGIKEYTVQEVMCSECGFTDDVSASIYTYCPECGAKMDGKVKQDET